MPGSALESLRGVPLEVSILLGTRRMMLGELLAIGEGAVLVLDRAADGPVDVLAGGALVARGLIVAVDGRFAVRITEVFGASDG